MLADRSSLRNFLFYKYNENIKGKVFPDNEIIIFLLESVV